MCLNKPRLLMSQNIKNIDKHQFRGNFADFFGTSIAELKKHRNFALYSRECFS